MSNFIVVKNTSTKRNFHENFCCNPNEDPTIYKVIQHA